MLPLSMLTTPSRTEARRSVLRAVDRKRAGVGELGVDGGARSGVPPTFSMPALLTMA